MAPARPSSSGTVGTSEKCSGWKPWKPTPKNVVVVVEEEEEAGAVATPGARFAAAAAAADAADDAAVGAEAEVGVGVAADDAPRVVRPAASVSALRTRLNTDAAMNDILSFVVVQGNPRRCGVYTDAGRSAAGRGGTRRVKGRARHRAAAGRDANERRAGV
mmetsp:Transcript_13649/g.32750  ORF Transcript_13649/g.32750 Transcript_13649/m.32750 type:complete len:161 (+) Transcript_13649:202-684(+)